ncbi:MAG TPA: hypothetical protein VHV78_05940, partial [Gemmatimonadaceae bacterium]|nr:hypothetical protein [Gemmatimonadaceae bacterium]
MCAAPSSAQSVAEYTRHVDSLARVWRAAAAKDSSADTVRLRGLPSDTIRVGAIIVSADSQYAALAREVAARLWPKAQRSYGRFAERLALHPFVLRDRGGAAAGREVLSGVVDSTGVVRSRSATNATADALASSWQQKIENVIADEGGGKLRVWPAAVIPLDPMSARSWSDARVALVLSSSRAGGC